MLMVLPFPDVRLSFFFLLPLPSTEENVFQREFSSRIQIEFNGRSYDYIFILRNGMFMQIEIPLNVTYTLFLFFYSVARRLRIIVMVIFSPFFLSHRTNFTRNREGRRGTSVEYIESNQSPRRGGKKKSKNRCANTRRKILYRFRCKDELSSDEVIL